MTREEAIRILASSCIPGSKQTEALETLIPELAESEDERVRKEIIHYILYKANGVSEKQEHEWIAYLEKQKEQEPDTEELVYRLNGLMQEYIKEGEDEEEHEHRFKCYKLFWDALEDSSYFDEQKPAEWNQDEFTENIRRLITDKLTITTKGSDGSTLSSTVFIDDKTAKNIANGILFYVGKEAQKNPDREIPEWSEEDEAIRDNILRCLQCFEGNVECESTPSLSTSYPLYTREIAWLKSLKPQKQDNNISISPERLKELRDQSFEDGRKAGIAEMAKSMPMPEDTVLFQNGVKEGRRLEREEMWKPSEEQMNELWATLIPDYEFDCDILKELYYDLKKL